MRRAIVCAIALACSASGLTFAKAPPAAASADVALSQPAPSPHGQRIAFVANGAIWSVPAAGGRAHLLVDDPDGDDARPLYSPDGRWLAFESHADGDARGIYVMRLDTHTVRRLTWSDTADHVDAWSADSRWLYIDSPRHNVGGMNGIFKLAVTGGTPMPVSVEAYRNESMAAPSPVDDSVALVGGGMGDWQWWRHGHSHLDEGAVWLLTDPLQHSYRRLTPDDARAEWPMWSHDGRTLYYMSDRSGSENLWRVPLQGKETPLTHFTHGRVLWPGIAADGSLIAFERGFGLWTLDPHTGTTRQVPVTLDGAVRDTAAHYTVMHDHFRDLVLSPDGKKLAFIAHGEVFAADADKGGRAQRLTHSRAAEFDPVWSPDSRHLVYGADRDGVQGLYEYDFSSGKAHRLPTGDGQDAVGSPQFSPDGTRLAFLRGQRELDVLDVKSGHLRHLLHAAIDLPRPLGGGRPLSWSPDGRWIAYLAWGPRMFRNVHAVNVAQGTIVRLSDLADTSADDVTWSPDRHSLFYTTGQRTEQGRVARVDLQPRTPQFQEDRFNELFKQQPPQQHERSEHDSREHQAGDNDADGEKTHTPKAPLRIDSRGIRQRLNLLPVGLDVEAIRISPDGKTLLLTAEVAGTSNLYTWSLDPLAKKPPVAKQITHSHGDKADAQFGPKGKRVVYLDKGTIKTLTLKSGKSKSIDVSAAMTVDFSDEKQVVFAQAWRWLRDTYHDPDMNGVDWTAVRTRFAPFIAGAANDSALYRLLDLMIGELDSSHSGAYAPGHAEPFTGRIGLRFDATAYAHSGQLRIAHVVPLSPAAVSGKIRDGMYLTAIDGHTLDAGSNLDELLAHRAGEKTTLRVSTDAAGRNAHDVAVKPVDTRTMAGLDYRAWVAHNRAYVARISQGRLGYVHLRDMSMAALNDFYKDLDAQNATRDGVVIDVRNNFGGFVNAYALDVIARRHYLNMTFRGFAQAQPARSILGQRALERPTILVTNRVTLSDGEDFTEGYRAMHLGKVVGEPTAGWIIYTSAGRLLDDGRVRLPFITVSDDKGQPMELHPRPVDVPVTYRLGESYQDRDSDLDAAVHTLLPATGR